MCVRPVEGIYAPELGQCHLQANYSALSTRVNLYVFPHPDGLDRAKKKGAGYPPDYRSVRSQSSSPMAGYCNQNS